VFKFKIGRTYNDFQFETQFPKTRDDNFKYFSFVPNQFFYKLNLVEISMDASRVAVFKSGGMSV